MTAGLFSVLFFFPLSAAPAPPVSNLSLRRISHQSRFSLFSQLVCVLGHHRLSHLRRIFALSAQLRTWAAHLGQGMCLPGPCRSVPVSQVCRNIAHLHRYWGKPPPVCGNAHHRISNLGQFPMYSSQVCAGSARRISPLHIAHSIIFSK